MMTTTTKTQHAASTKANRITKTVVDAAKVALDTVQAGARQRVLDGRDIEIAVDAYRSGREYATRRGLDPDTVHVTFDAEGVKGSYKYSAESTSCYVDKTGIKVVRGGARQGKDAVYQRLIITIEIGEDAKAADFSPMPWGSDRKLYGKKYAGRIRFEV